MNIHNVILYVHNFDQSDKFQVVFEAHGSSLLTAKIVCTLVSELLQLIDEREMWQE